MIFQIDCCWPWLLSRQVLICQEASNTISELLGNFKWLLSGLFNEKFKAIFRYWYYIIVTHTFAVFVNLIEMYQSDVKFSHNLFNSV